MVGYKVYLFEGTKGYELIAVLPERRKNEKRKTEESVINWGRTLLGDGGKGKDILFERVIRLPSVIRKQIHAGNQRRYD